MVGVRLVTVRRAQRDADFAEYVAAARPRLRRLAYGLCGDWHAADDVVQDALARLYVAWPRVVRASNPDAYVRRTVLRSGVDASRRPWRRERAGLDGHDRPLPEADLDTRHDLIDVLQRLPVMQRRAVVLRHWLGLSVAETAADLGISEGTVKSHTSRALDRLHTLLTADVTSETQP